MWNQKSVLLIKRYVLSQTVSTMVGFTIRGTDSRPVTDVTFFPVIRTALWTVRTKNVIIVSFYTLRLVFFTSNFRTIQIQYLYFCKSFDTILLWNNIVMQINRMQTYIWKIGHVYLKSSKVFWNMCYVPNNCKTGLLRAAPMCRKGILVQWEDWL